MVGIAVKMEETGQSWEVRECMFVYVHVCACEVLAQGKKVKEKFNCLLQRYG